jgi:hypothetical protein
LVLETDKDKHDTTPIDFNDFEDALLWKQLSMWTNTLSDATLRQRLKSLCW